MKSYAGVMGARCLGWRFETKREGTPASSKVETRSAIFCADVVAEGGCKGGFDVVVADLEEVQGVFVDAAGDVILDLQFSLAVPQLGELNSLGLKGVLILLMLDWAMPVVDCGAENAAVPGVAESEVLVHGDFQQVC